MFTDEKTLEDWAETNIEQVVGWKRAVLVGRQLSLPSGARLDLLAMVPASYMPKFIVVELKRADADAAAVLQLLGYMGEVSECMATIDRVVTVHGVLAAPGVTSDACRAINAINPSLRRISFVQLGVEITARRWSGLSSGDTSRERRQALATLLADENDQYAPPQPPLPEDDEADDLLRAYVARLDGDRIQLRRPAVHDVSEDWRLGELSRLSDVARYVLRTRYPGGTNAIALPAPTNGARP